MKHVVGAILFIVVMSVFAIGILNVDLLMPAGASAQAVPIDRAF